MPRNPKSSVAEELKRIYTRDDGLRSNVVVREARKKNSPLHSEFEWDDTEAGKGFRLIQARNLIRSVKVTVVGDDGKADVTVPMFVHVPSDKKEEGVYHTQEVLAEHPDMYLRAITEARSTLHSAAASFRQLETIARGDGKTESVVAIIGIAEKGIATALEAVKKLEAA